jgi:hypothetical protein
VFAVVDLLDQSTFESSDLWSQISGFCVCCVWSRKARVEVVDVGALGRRGSSNGGNGPAGQAYTSLHALLAKRFAADPRALRGRLAGGILNWCCAENPVEATPSIAVSAGEAIVAIHID